MYVCTYVRTYAKLKKAVKDDKPNIFKLKGETGACEKKGPSHFTA